MQVICVDKTGTLTTNTMTVTRAAIPSMHSHLREFSIATHTPPPAPGPTRTSSAPTIIDLQTGAAVERPADIAGLRVAATVGAVCNDAKLTHDLSTGKFSHVGESMEGALCLFAERVGQSSQILEPPAVSFSMCLLQFTPLCSINVVCCFMGDQWLALCCGVMHASTNSCCCHSHSLAR